MGITEFWELLDKTRKAAGGDPRKQSDLLTNELAKLHENEIILFNQIFRDFKDRAYIGNLWDAAAVIMYGCSDDGFQEFREWLVGRGKAAYENAINDPETLVDILEVGEQIFPTLLSPALEAYEKVTGKNMPPMPRERAPLQGRPTLNIDADEAVLVTEISARFPKLTAKFWEWWTRDKIYIDIRNMLREMLVPGGFLEREIKSLGVVKFQRNQFTVETMLDSDNDGPYISLYVSNELSKKGAPIRQLAMNVDYHAYNEDKKKAIHASIQEWLITIGL
jgi:hypothetical protein